MFSTVSNVPPRNVFETSSDLVISSWNLLMESDNLVRPWPDNTVDLRETEGKAIADFRVESTNTSEAVLVSDQNNKTNSNVGEESALTATCSSDHPDNAYSRDFYNASSLKRHARTHTGEHPFQCDLCKSNFVSAGNLKRHKKIHTGERPFKCEECNKSFKERYNLTIHMDIHNKTPRVDCKVCGARFYYRNMLTRHMCTHNKSRLFRCDTCGSEFKTHDRLLAHKQNHVNEQRHYKCDICTKAFRGYRSLWNHERIHVNERRYKCDKCTKAFKTSNTLWHHQKTHTDGHPFRCDICDFGSKRKQSLEKHYQNIHGRKYPDKSSKSFTNDRNSGRHSSQPESGHGNEEPFRGSHCDAGFTSITISNQHIKPKTHTTYSETGVTNLNDVSTTSQLPFISNQPSTSSIHVNKSQNQKEYSEYAETVALLNEFADTYPVTPKPGSCERDNNLSFTQEMPEKTFPDRQIADAGCLITQLHPVVDRPSTSSLERHYQKTHSRKYPGKSSKSFTNDRNSGRNSSQLESGHSNQNDKTSSNVGEESALTATCSSDHLDTEQGKYDTGDKIYRQTRLSKSKKPKAINSVALPYEDQMCNTDARVKGDLARHKETHDIKRSFRCDICDRELSSPFSLNRHVKILHPGESHFQCDICKSKFSSANCLEKHVRTHTDERTFQCDVCNSEFKTRNRLLAHKRNHVNEYHHKCDKCTKTFRTSHSLWDHKRIHVNERHFKCEECTKAFRTYRSLWNHEQTHVNERRHKCDKCTKAFKTSNALWHHKQTHTDRHPFKCDICASVFRRKSTVKRHYENIHGEKYPDKSSKSSTNDRNSGRNSSQPESGHGNAEPFRSSHCDAGFTSTTISNQHIKPKTHTTYSETGVTNLNDVSTTSQLPFISNQPSTSGIHVNKSQNQEEYCDAEEIVAFLHELADTYPVTPEPGSCGHDNNLSFAQKMPEETFPDRQIADAGCLITQLHPVVDRPSTSGIHVNKLQNQEKHEKTAKVLDYNYLQTIHSFRPSRKSGLSSWQLR